MNKKFTFMVAALLAAGSVFADPTAGPDFAQATKGYYYLQIGGTNFFGAEYNEVTGAITYDGTKVVSDVESAGDGYIWEVEVKANKEVVLKNKLTGKVLAVNESLDVPALVSNVLEYTNGSELSTTFKLTGTTGTYELAYGESKELKIDGTLDANSNNNYVTLYKVTDEKAKVSELKNIGTGIKMDLEGTITGEDIFNSVSFVTVSNGGSLLSGFTASTDEKFMIQVGSATYSDYDLTDASQLAAFKAAEFIVLTSTAVDGVEADAAEGIGYKYAKVKGEKLFYSAVSVDDKKSDEYPVMNAVYTAYKNANKEGKYVFQNTAFWKATANGTTPANNDWDEVSSTTPYIGYADAGIGGVADALASAAVDKACWATVSGGSAVEVKNLVKGQWVVNILASEDKNSTVMKRLVYAKQNTSTSPVISKDTDDTNAHKDAVYAQWIVSANKDENTVTFINRENADVKIEKVTLFTTPKEGVYSLSTATTVNPVSGSAKGLTASYIELRTVENTTQWDGFLKVSDDDINSTEYTLSVENTADVFGQTELAVVANSDADALTKDTDTDATNALKFKLAPASIKIGQTTKKDTIMVNDFTYGYYKDGVYTTAKDTLKAISYNLTSLQNAGAQGTTANAVVTPSFGLDDKDATAGNFIFRKVGEQYQIALKGDYTTNDVVKFNTVFVFTSGSVADNQLFNLNAIKFEAPAYDVPESHIALQINGAYLGSKADGNAIMTNDTSLLKSTVADASFSFYAFSADKEEAKTPSYYLSSNGKMMYSPANEIAALQKEYDALSPVFDAEEREELKGKIDAYKKNGEVLVKFQRAKYEAADKVALADTTYTKAEDLKPFKFNVYDIDGQAVLKNGSSNFVKVLNDVVVFTSDEDQAAKFDVVAAEAPTSNESVSASEVKVIANNGSIVVKNAAGKNVVVSTILGQVVANEVLTSDNATINVPAGIVVVAVEGESFKVNVK